STAPEQTGRKRCLMLVMSKNWARHHRTDAVWLLASACGVLVVAACCAAHALIATHDEEHKILRDLSLEKANVVERLLCEWLGIQPLVALPVTALLLAVGVFLCKKSFDFMRKEEPRQQLLEGPVIAPHSGIFNFRWTERARPYSRICFALLLLGCVVVGSDS